MLSSKVQDLLPRGSDELAEAINLCIADAVAAEQRACSDIALALDSLRGNEKLISQSILSRNKVTAGQDPEISVAEHPTSSSSSDHFTFPSIDSVKALDGRIFSTLNETEQRTLDIFVAQGRIFGVSVVILNQADPVLLAAAKSLEETDSIMKSANSVVSVIVN